MTEFLNPVKRYPGVRWLLRYGQYDGLEKFAFDELQKKLQSFFPYVITCQPATQDVRDQDANQIIIGTPDSNPVIAALIDNRAVSVTDNAQGYTILSGIQPWNKERKMIVIAGKEPSGVLYGVQDFDNRILSDICKERPNERQEALDAIGEFTIADYPRIQNRGIWTWGYAVYDYVRFIDNMARLKMNMLTIWNDCPPINCSDVVDYAHSRGIKVILGFHWGWGMKNISLAKEDDRNTLKQIVLNTYKEHYQDLSFDGIYFQTLTEHSDRSIDGVSVASLSCSLVNEVSRELFEIDPELYIQFGLHASSIGENCNDFRDLDPRVVITWEDAGTTPYSYDPVPCGDTQEASMCKDIRNSNKTKQYSQELAQIRPGAEFAMVAKGWTCIRWDVDFEHHGPFVLGQRSREFIRKRLELRQPRWNKVNPLWIRNLHHAQDFYQTLLKTHKGITTVTALVEDGMFEERIQPSVALFSECLWNPYQDSDDVIERLTRIYGTN